MSGRIVVLSGRDRPAPAVTALLDTQNRFVGPRVLRHWQHAVLTTGRLRAAWPLDGTMLDCDATLWLEHGLFAYRFRHGAMTMWLLTGGCKNGWQICGLAMMPMGLAFAIDGADAATLVAHYLHHLAGTGVPQGHPMVQVVLGHPNFAHHLWNELPALAAGAAFGVEAVVLWEPILPLQFLVDWAGPVRRSVEAAERPAPGTLLAGIRLPLGSTQIPAETAARTRAACAVHDAMSPGRPGVPAVSLGLRSMHRHPVNQIAFYRALLARLPPVLDVYLDGFSMPDDIGVAGRYDARVFRAWQADTAAMAQQLMSAPPQAGQKLVDATRLSVPQSIALGARLHAHVAPHGTQQHKFGWMQPLPGVVHTSPHIAHGDPSVWLADQCEVHGPTTYLPAGMVETVAGNGPLAGHAWFDDYRFVDIDEAAAYAARILAPHLAA